MRFLKLTLALVLLTPFIALPGVFLVYYEPHPGDDAPRVLVSVDRTAWNRVGLNQLTYVRHLRRQGLSPVLVSFPDPGEPINLEGLFENIDGLVLTGGGDVAAERYGGDPSVTRGVITARDAFETGLLDVARQRQLPLLGLCRGAQLLNVYRGGTLGDMRDNDKLFSRHRNAFARHDVQLAPESRLAMIYGDTTVTDATSWHGQFVDRPGEGIRVSATADDGIPEAIEAEGSRFVVGVQWHAEMPPWVDAHDPLFEAYADAVRQASTK